MAVFKKLKIQSNFNRAAVAYNKLAVLQKTVAENLVKYSDKYIDNAKSIIDLGSGTGFVSNNILSNPKYNKKKIIQLDIAKEMLLQNQAGGKILNINADIESLPFKSKTFDLAISSLAFQWLNSLNVALSEVSYILKPKSVLVFSLIANGSLKELKKTCEECQINLSINSFINEEELRKVLSLKFDDFEIKSEKIILKYDDAINLLKSIKSIGAGYSSNKNNLTAKDFKKINSFYLKNFNSDNKVFCTWQILYAICVTNKQ